MTIYLSLDNAFLLALCALQILIVLYMYLSLRNPYRKQFNMIMREIHDNNLQLQNISETQYLRHISLKQSNMELTKLLGQLLKASMSYKPFKVF